MEGFGSEIDFLQTAPDPSAYDVFRCPFPRCNARYRRKEHLNRHERSKHINQQAFVCSRCGHVKISDTLRRHVQKQHKITEPLNRARRACAGCQAGKSRCEGGVPCEECVRRNIHCSLQDRPSIAEDQQTRSSTAPSSSLHREHSQLYWDKTKKWVDRYFDIFHRRWPFIHRGSFNVRRETPLLLQSMIVIGMWTSGEQSAQSAAVELYDQLDSAIQDQRERWDASEVETACSACVWPIATYQAILLHLIFSVIMKDNGVVNLDLKPSISAAGLALLKSLVGSCRRLGMFFYPNMLARFKEADLPALVWVSIEEVKRFNMALYKLCTTLSSSTTEDRPLLHASELQFPLPSNDPLWNAVGRAGWEANAKGENMVSLKDDLQAKWISRYAD
ncbi:hypothetical protein KXW83_008332 [Aspergillus fumigatus]|uniref:Uncharacterized protein n=1 Tax=Aspergillus fumigatus TaxID=746128 RepID=A0A229Y573_ASPFM|nr:hypothetical protein KXX38_000265 [Aspergillus fumigatus]KAH1387989.1 hypothetical protein KXX50_002836 [Aspergillus fumigatus]KAH1421140.1 hypothetical protein KXX22_003713 [Aspergillus fumigatus]KAH1469030.1 hypothetical protein KXX58_001718 [Aspergillus fumigatus]KAH1644631.1 hypothetical protein KXX59_008973 [Aspergillus fumigatus]